VRGVPQAHEGQQAHAGHRADRDGCISPHNLQHSLVLQLQHKVWDAFSWDEGEYQFIADAPLPAEPLSIA